MTDSEFRKEVEEFWYWVSKRERKRSHWYLSLLEWSEVRWSEAYKKESATET